MREGECGGGVGVVDQLMAFFPGGAEPSIYIYIYIYIYAGLMHVRHGSNV